MIPITFINQQGGIQLLTNIVQYPGWPQMWESGYNSSAKAA